MSFPQKNWKHAQIVCFSPKICRHGSNNILAQVCRKGCVNDCTLAMPGEPSIFARNFNPTIDAYSQCLDVIPECALILTMDTCIHHATRRNLQDP